MENLGVTYNLPGMVSGVFFTKRDADAAYHALLEAGHTPDDISVLMSDETLSNHKAVYTQDYSGEVEMPESKIEKTRDKISSAIISITAMISLPGLGIAISNRLFKRISEDKAEADEKTVESVIGSAVADTHSVSYGEGMREGGIIISVDPRNAEEKREIVNAFRINNGHDILGDDGYTELG